MEDKSHEGKIKYTITAHGSSTFIAWYFINGGMYYIYQRKSYREK